MLCPWCEYTSRAVPMVPAPINPGLSLGGQRGIHPPGEDVVP